MLPHSAPPTLTIKGIIIKSKRILEQGIESEPRGVIISGKAKSILYLSRLKWEGLLEAVRLEPFTSCRSGVREEEERRKEQKRIRHDQKRVISRLKYIVRILN